MCADVVKRCSSLFYEDSITFSQENLRKTYSGEGRVHGLPVEASAPPHSAEYVLTHVLGSLFDDDISPMHYTILYFILFIYSFIYLMLNLP